MGDVQVHFVLCFLFSSTIDDIQHTQSALSQKRNQNIITYTFLSFLFSNRSQRVLLKVDSDTASIFRTEEMGPS
jgi:hypothetical protein